MLVYRLYTRGIKLYAVETCKIFNSWPEIFIRAKPIFIVQLEKYAIVEAGPRKRDEVNFTKKVNLLVFEVFGILEWLGGVAWGGRRSNTIY